MSLNTQKNISYNQSLKGAIVGFGGVAEHAHAPILKNDPRFCIKAIVEPISERASVAKDIFPEATIYEDVDALFKKEELDFLDICTPPLYHAEIILKACEKKVNIMCEKPLVTSLEDLKKVLRASKEAGVVLFCVNNWKYAPIWSKAIEFVNKGIIGEIQRVSLTVLRTPKSGGGVTNWRRSKKIAGGGILMDHGWHHIYFIHSIIKKEPIHVSAKMEYINSDESGLEDKVDLDIGYENSRVNMYFTWRSSLRRNFGQILGEKGCIILEDDHLILKRNGDSLRYNFNSPLSKGSHHLEWMRPVLDNFFIELIDTNKRGDNLKEATICLYLILLAYKSQKNNGIPIKVSNILNDK